MSRRRRWRPPRRVRERRALLERGGPKCFLVPSKASPKYPVCNNRGQVTCQGLWAAWNRAGTQRAYAIRRKALQRARAKGCSWTKER